MPSIKRSTIKLFKRVLARSGYKVSRIRPRGNETRAPAQSPLPLGDVSDLVYRVGDWRYEIPLRLAVGRPCFGYGRDAWHPYVAAVRELIQHSDLDYDKSLLKSHFDRWQPQSVAQSHFPAQPDPDPTLERIPARSLFEPWIGRPPPCDNPFDPDCRPAGSPLFGPLRDGQGEAEFERLRKMLHSIQTYGYRPDDFPRGLIRIAVLRHRGQTRYLIAHGQHRAAVLSALGRDKIVVGIHRDLPPLIDSNDLQSWPHVSNGNIDPLTAERMLARFFPPDSDSHPSLHVASKIITS